MKLDQSILSLCVSGGGSVFTGMCVAVVVVVVGVYV